MIDSKIYKLTPPTPRNQGIAFGCGRDKPPAPKSSLKGFKVFRAQLADNARSQQRKFIWQAVRTVLTSPLVVIPQLFKSTRVGKAQPAMRPEAKTLHDHVNALTQWERSYLNMKDTASARDYIQQAWTGQGLTVETQPVETPRGTFSNMMVSFGPKDAPRIIVGAHYDVCVTEYPGGFKPGADDNTSSVSAILELTRLLKAHAPKLKYRIDVVAFANEEPPFFRSEHMGSAVHAQSLKAANVPIKAMLALDCIGYFSDKKNSQKLPPLMDWLYPTTGNYIAMVGELGSLNLVRKAKKGFRKHATIPTYALSAPALIPGIDFSDHQNYSKYGWPAIMVTDTAMNRNPNYHKNSDTPDTLNYEKMADVVQGLYGLLVNF